MLKKEILKSERDWQFKLLSDDEFDKLQHYMIEACIQYCVHNRLTVSQLKESSLQVKKILPFLGEIDEKWKSVTKENYNENQFNAHKDLLRVFRRILRNDKPSI